MGWRVINADCIEALRALPDNSIDAIVSDPPYGLEFMGKDWDAPWKATGEVVADPADVGGFQDGNGGNPFSRSRVRYGRQATFTGAGMSAPGIGERDTPWPSSVGSNTKRCGKCGLLVGQGGSPCQCAEPDVRNLVPERMHGFQWWCEQWARECYRVLKPGGYIAAFGGTRTYHRLASAIEDVGFEIRDSLHWIYGSGFPKSLNVSKAVDDKLGATREVVGPSPYNARRPNPPSSELCAQAGWPSDITVPATPEATRWDGWGTALKPSHEPIVLARKPLIGTVAANVLEHGTGGLNIDGCRVGSTVETWPSSRSYGGGFTPGLDIPEETQRTGPVPPGRWPPNVLFTHGPMCFPLTDKEDGPWDCEAECPVAELDRQSGESTSRAAPAESFTDKPNYKNEVYGRGMGGCVTAANQHMDTGGASRFFPVFNYTAKPARGERDAGLEGAPEGRWTDGRAGVADFPKLRDKKKRANHHPTVKPVALMEWLVRLVTPPGGTVLDPFLGSGTTGCAAVRLGFEFVGIEREAEYAAIAERRIKLAENAPRAKPLSALVRSDDGVLPGQISLFAANEKDKDAA